MPARRLPRSRATTLSLVGMLVAVVIAYAPGLRGPFVFDDLAAIVLNPTIDRLTPLSVPLQPPPRTAVSGRPVVNLTLAMNRAMSVRNGANETLPFHATNVLLHILSAVCY
jgi:protein O-mannosyl-transferase